MHNFWSCTKISKFWEEFSHWWSLDSQQPNLLINNIWAARNVFYYPKVKAMWNIVLSAVLWTIQLGRNELHFQSISTDIHTLILLVKIRSFKWIMASGDISSELETLWNVNPMGAFLLHSKHVTIEGPIW